MKNTRKRLIKTISLTLCLIIIIPNLFAAINAAASEFEERKRVIISFKEDLNVSTQNKNKIIKRHRGKIKTIFNIIPYPQIKSTEKP